MAKLTLTVDSRSAETAIARLTRLLDATTQASIRNANIAKGLSVHYRNAAGMAQSLTRQVNASSAAAIKSASSSKQIAANYTSAVGQAQNLARQIERGAAASRKFKPVGVGGGGGGGRGGSRTIIDTTARRLETATTSAVSGGFSAASGVVTGVIGGAVKGGLRVALRFFQTGLKTAAAAGIAVAVTSATLAVREQPVSGAFGSIVEDRGLGDQASVLRDLQQAADGTVTRYQLMLNANRALFLGAATTTDQLGFLAQAGRRLGEATGRTATEGFEDLALGIGRGSRLILDNLGIVVRADEAYKAYADSIGDTVNALSEEEKKLIFTEAAYASIEKKLESLGDEQDTARKSIDRTLTSLSDLASEIGSTSIPAITDLGNKWSAFVSTFSADEILGAINSGASAAGRGASGALDALLGSRNAARQGFTALGDDLIAAFTNPSREAWEIVFTQGKRFLILMGGEFEAWWIDVKTAGVSAIQGVLREGLKGIIGSSSALKLNPILAPIADQLSGGGADLALDALGIGDGALADFKSVQNSRKEIARGEAAIEANKLLQGITDLRLTIETSREVGGGSGIDVAFRQLISTAVQGFKVARESQTLSDLGYGGAPGFIPASSGSLTGSRAAAGSVGSGGGTAGATERRRAVEAAAEAEKRRVEAAAEAAKAEVAERRKLIKTLEGEVSRRRGLLEDLEDAQAAARNAAIEAEGGRAPGTTLVDLLDNIAAELQDMPGVIADANEAVKEATEARREAEAEHVEAIRQAKTNFANQLQQEAKSFLLGGGVVGETTRVRSLRRKAQREQRRGNKAIFQREFGSRGFGGGGPLPGGFGSQGVERSGGVLGGDLSGLQNALAQITNNDGTTKLQQQRDLLAQLATKQNEELSKLVDQETELAAKLADERQKAEELQREQLELNRRAIEAIERHTKRLEEVERDIAQQKRDMEEAARRAARRRL